MVKDVVKAWPNAGIIGLDSDRWVSKPYGEHIYNMFFELGRSAALVQIEARERAFLSSLEPTDAPRLIAMGPAVPSRHPQWQDFCDRVRPTFIYLDQSAGDVLTALRKRRADHAADPNIANHPLFGSWDDDVTTADSGGGWVEVGDAEALANVRRHMRQLEAIYKRYTDPSHVYPREVHRGLGHDRVIEEVGTLLGLPERES